MLIKKGKINEISNLEKISFCFGNFDGVHHGHQVLINNVLSYKDTLSAVMIFSIHPNKFFNKDFKELYTLDDKIKYFENIGIDILFIVEFDEDFLKTSALDFIQILKNLNVVRIVCGKDVSFGANKSGNLELLKNYFEVIAIDDLKYKGIRISSTIIKQNLNLSELLLGKDNFIYGKVVHGDKLGTVMGYPTINIDLINQINAKPGVYGGICNVKGIDYLCVVNIGHNISLNYSKELKIESFLIDFNETIYDSIVYITLVKFLRLEIKYDSIDKLSDQIGKDINDFKDYLSNNIK
jgi:riboflavin kinase/FMN adenylyltransferase